MFAPRTAVAARATGGPSTRFPAASCSGAICLGLCRRRCWVGRSYEGPFGVCSVGLLRARPGSPLGDGMLCPQRYCATIRRDQQGGHGLLAQAQTSEPERYRGAFPCVRQRALLSWASARPCSRPAASELRRGTAVWQSRTEPSGTSIARTCAKSSCHIWLWTRLMRWPRRSAMGSSAPLVWSRAAAFS